MGIIGNNNVAGATGQVGLNDFNRQYRVIGYPYVPAENEVALTAYFRASVVSGPGTVEVGVYRDSDNALLGKTTITLAADSGQKWYSAAMPPGVNIATGDTYHVGFADPTVDVNLEYSSQTHEYGDFSSTLDDPFVSLGTASRGYLVYVETATAETAPTTRKGSTLDIETALSGTVTAATLNSVDVSDHITGQTGTTVSFDGGLTAEITASGEYDLVLTDDSADPDETITVQVNVVGLASYNINKDGADQTNLTDVEFIIMTGAAGSRAIAEQITGVTTDASGDTGPIEVTDLSLDAGDTVLVLQQSDTVGGGIPHEATLVAI